VDAAKSEIQEFPPNNQVISSKGDVRFKDTNDDLRHIAAIEGTKEDSSIDAKIIKIVKILL